MHTGIFKINASQECTVTCYTRGWTNWNMHTKKEQLPPLSAVTSQKNLILEYKVDISRLCTCTPLVMFIYLFAYFVQTGSPIAQAGLEFAIDHQDNTQPLTLLPLPPQFWVYRYALLFFKQMKASPTIDKHSTFWSPC